MFFKNQGHNEF